MQTLFVEVKSGSYPIYIGCDLDLSALIADHIRARQVMIVTNETVAPLYLEWLTNACADAAQVSTCVLPDGERYKTQVSMDAIYDALMTASYNRDAVVVALGGGVVGDMAGFAAASFQRGIDFIQVPTTLLSQVDSSVGGKTGINHKLGKNMIGAFKQPKAVLIDTQVLNTLPDREVSAGLAEVVKYALIADTEFLAWLEVNMTNLVAKHSDTLIEAIYRSCQHKAKIVAEDEFEAGKRALLNLGHTFGHAIENHMGYGEWLHGEAVAVGMLQAAHLSRAMDMLSADDVVRVYELLKQANLPTKPPSMTVNQFLTLMSRDKKVKAGKIRFVLLRQLGDAILTDQVPPELLEKTLIQKHLLMI